MSAEVLAADETGAWPIVNCFLENSIAVDVFKKIAAGRVLGGGIGEGGPGCLRLGSVILTDTGRGGTPTTA